VATAGDLVRRDFTRDRPNQLWLTDSTEHPTREGKPTAASCSTRTHAGSLADRSTATGHRRWLRTRQRWQSAPTPRRQGPWSIPITAANSPPRRSANHPSSTRPHSALGCW